MRKIHIRNAYNYDADVVSLITGLECKDPTLTQQNQKEEADINVILKDFGITGMLPQAAHLPSYQDFDGVFDYMTARNAVIEAERSFGALDAKIRKRFGNDPAEFIEFCENPENLEELRKMGLAPAVEPSIVPIAVAEANDNGDKS